MSFGWRVVTLKYGRLLQAAADEPGGRALTDWIDNCPNALYSALVYQGGTAWRDRLEHDFKSSSNTATLVGQRSDAELARLMSNLGGHDLPTILDAFGNLPATGPESQQPTCFIAYTVKGFGLPLAGHKDNHAGQLSPAQFAAFQAECGVAAGAEWDPMAGIDVPEKKLRAFLDAVPFDNPPADLASSRRRRANAIATPDRLRWSGKSTLSTQAGFGQILDALARDDNPIAAQIVTTSPDVTVSTNLGSWGQPARFVCP